MTTQSKQEISIAALERAGFRFANWIGDEGDQEAVMVRSKRGTHHYGQVDATGLVNGEPLETFLQWARKAS